MAEDKLPLSDDEPKDDPFEEFINKDLGMDSVPKKSDAMSPDDKAVPSPSERSQSMDYAFGEDDDDDDSELEDDEPSPRTLPRFGGFSARFTPSSPNYTDNPFRSPFGRPLSGGSGVFGSSGSAFGGRAARPTGGAFGIGALRPSIPPPAPKSGWQRLRHAIVTSTLDGVAFILVGLGVLLMLFSSIVYIDDLRLSIALRDGQIQELRTQVEQLQRQVSPTLLPTATTR